MRVFKSLSMLCTSFCPSPSCARLYLLLTRVLLSLAFLRTSSSPSHCYARLLVLLMHLFFIYSPGPCMNGGEIRTNTFNEEGRILQVEYAIKNVSNAGTTLGLTCTDGIVLLGITTTNKNHIISRNEKIYRITGSIYCTISGIFSDGLQIISMARFIAQEYLYRNGVEMSIGYLVEEVAMRMQYFTQGGGMRPFGVSFLFAQVRGDECLLYSTDPAGSCNRWRAKAFGQKEDSINNALQSNADRQFTLEEGVRECFKVVMQKQEITESNAANYEVLFITKDRSYFLKSEDVKRIIRDTKGDVE
ncbi:20S proteasome, regulatory subunit alpha type PSMA4/PRE9 [Trachipleistophora hominis]|uniref:20S proteasome, regulatory subunit alpha type PSMA4/PRE9 n=1 Tax=Trachipleistophora hominis TaxID=72359 RepID=L7JUG1_TRAHO|nr:20S proteasome, regulatory subunit alpha type PSMA4/PRE9 [Trachipleistophora hominis]